MTDAQETFPEIISNPAGMAQRGPGWKPFPKPVSLDIAKGGIVVIAEDADDARELLALSLTIQGYTVYTASTGAEALALVKAHRPKALIADILMPDMNGFELATQIRATYFDSVRLIALTGMAPREAWCRAVECGFDYYLMKPISADALIFFIDGPLTAHASDV